MSVKALRNQLLAAIAMVLVAALALGSSTFAWFAASETVTAKEMKVKAKTEEGLLIATYTAETTATDGAPTTAPNPSSFATVSASSISTPAELFPTSTANTTDWFHTTAAAVNQYAKADGLEWLPVANDLTTNPDTLYYAHHKFHIKATNSSSPVWIKSVTAQADGSATSANIDKCIRVAVVMGSNTYFFAPNEESGTFTYVGKASEGNNGSQKTYGAQGNNTLYVGTGTATTVPNQQIATVNYEQGSAVDIFVYYEGEDPHCTTNYAMFDKNTGIQATDSKVNIDTLNVTVEFSATNPYPANTDPQQP